MIGQEGLELGIAAKSPQRPVACPCTDRRVRDKPDGHDTGHHGGPRIYGRNNKRGALRHVVGGFILDGSSRFMTSQRRPVGHVGGPGFVVALILAFGVLLLTDLSPAQAADKDKKDDGRGEVILSNLPPEGSPAYKELLRIAGQKAKGQILKLTQSEVWKVPRKLIGKVKAHCEKTGVDITPVPPDWNQILKPPPKLSMTNAQDLILEAIQREKQITSVGVMTSPDAALIEYALLRDSGLQVSAGDDGRTRVVIPINDKLRVTAARTRKEMHANGCVWHGEIVDTGEPVILMWFKNEQRYTGMFSYKGYIYNLVNIGNGVHAVVESDPSQMPPDHAPVGSGPAGNVTLQDDPVAARGEGAIRRATNRANLRDSQDATAGGGPSSEPTQNTVPPAVVALSDAKRQALAAKNITIDIMVLYTPRVAAKYVDVDTDLLALSIEQTNQSFKNSGLGNISLNLVHSQKIDYDERGHGYFGNLYRMVDGEGVFSMVRRLRDEKRADVVALSVDDPSGCGLSTRVAADADEAYVVVHHACAALTYTLAHEVGHIIGARHDRQLDPTPSPFPYGHGYVNGTKWRDIMSYRSSCGGCPRLPFWSSPTVKVRGELAGSIDTDNARVLLEQAERVSHFR
jgi:Metallo-peptidase family M12